MSLTAAFAFRMNSSLALDHSCFTTELTCRLYGKQHKADMNTRLLLRGRAFGKVRKRVNHIPVTLMT